MRTLTFALFLALPIAGAAPVLAQVDVEANDRAHQRAPEASPGRSRLLELCKAGRLDSTFENACFEAIEQRARPALGDDAFWEWLRSEPEVQGSACAAATQVGHGVFSNLALLAERHPKDVARYPALAVAFAAAWTQGDGPGPALFWVDGWLTEGRATPHFQGSFADLVARAQDLRFPLRGAPWQVLAHLADSIVPTEERAWAFAKYDSRKTPGLRDLFGAVQWTLEPKRTGGPYTLQSFLECGGPCTHNVQFAGGIFDAFGIPSGWAGGPGHTYPYWFEMDGKNLRIFRTNELGNRNGKIRDPLSRGHIWEDRLRLQVAALNHGKKAHSRASLAAWAFRQIPEEHRLEASPILAAAIDASPLCHGALFAAAEATSARQIPPGTAGKIWRKAAGAMAQSHPEELGTLLDMAFPVLGEGPPNFDGDIALLGRFEKRAAGRIASWRFGAWRAQALASQGKLPAARRALSAAALELAPRDSNGFQPLLRGLVAITEPGNERTKTLRSLLADIEVPKDGESREPLRARLLTAAALHLASGETDHGVAQSRVWVEELIAQQDRRHGAPPKERDDSAEDANIGGGGGAPFFQQVDGARLVGLRVTKAGFNGRTVIGSIQGIFAAEGEAPSAHGAAGGVRSDAVDLTVPKGWILWGVVAAGSDRVDGIQIIATPGPRWRGKAYVSPWVGSAQGNARLLGGTAGAITGLTGRAGADLDAVGVRLAPH